MTQPPGGADPDPPALVVEQVETLSLSPLEASWDCPRELWVMDSLMLMFPVMRKFLSLDWMPQDYSFSALQAQHSECAKLDEALLGT